MRSLLIFLSLVLSSLTTVGQQIPSGPRINAPASALHDESVVVSVSGLNAGTLYSVRAEFVSRAGTVWRAEAQFRADEKGVIELASMAPASGSYAGIDPLGLFWSMENTKERQTDPSLFETDDQSVITITAREGEKTVAQHLLVLRKRQIGISSTEMRGEITGTFLAPSKGGRIPGIIVLGGSEGGIPRDLAALIASHGYAALALAYFAADARPKELERVPLETVDRAVEWLRKQQTVDPNRIAIVGLSKGAELALLSASRNPRIRAVVAIAPSSTVFQNLGRARATTSSWTSGGVDVPFAPFVQSDAFVKTRRLVDLYNASLAAAPPEARIPVEKISGPILLLSGKDDALWPSAKMSNQIAEQLAEHHFRYSVVNRSFDDVGHHVANIPMRPTADSVRLGGKAPALAKTQLDAWREIVSFLNANTGARNAR